MRRGRRRWRLLQYAGTGHQHGAHQQKVLPPAAAVSLGGRLLLLLQTVACSIPALGCWGTGAGSGGGGGGGGCKGVRLPGRRHEGITG